MLQLPFRPSNFLTLDDVTSGGRSVNKSPKNCAKFLAIKRFLQKKFVGGEKQLFIPVLKSDERKKIVDKSKLIAFVAHRGQERERVHLRESGCVFVRECVWNGVCGMVCVGWCV